MKTTIFNIDRSITFRLYYFVILIVSLLQVSCIKDNVTSDPIAGNKDVFEVSLSSSQSSSLLSLTESREIKLDKISILVFDENEKYLYAAPVIDMKYSTSTGIYNLKFKLIRSRNDLLHTLVFIANYSPSLDKNSIGKSKTELLSNMDFSNLESGNKYKWLDEENYFPMWGEIKAVIDSDTSKFGLVKLIRAISRVDFGFNYTVNEQEDSETYSELKDINGNLYALNSVYIFKAVDKGLVAPNKENIDSDSLIPINPSLPNDLKKLDPIEISLDENITTILKQKIYLTENVGGIAGIDDTNVTTFVLGFHNNSFEGTDNVRYFRADLSDENNKVFRPFLRNKRYVINIKNVKGTGYSTPDEAYRREVDVDLSVNVTEWKSSKTDNYIGNKDYEKVILSKRNVNLTYSRDNKEVISLYTNVDPKHISFPEVNEFFNVSINKSADQPSDFPEDFGDKGEDGRFMGLIKYDLVFTPIINPSNDPIYQKGSLKISAGSGDYLVDVKLYTNRFSVNLDKTIVKGRYIKDYPISMHENGSNEYIQLSLDYENFTDTPQTYKFTLTATKKDGDVYFQYKDYSITIQPNEKGNKSINLNAFGTPTNVGNMVYDIKIDNNEVNLEESDKKLVVVFTYRAMRIFFGDNDKKTTNGVIQQMYERGIIGNSPNSIVKTQFPVYISYQTGDEHKIDKHIMKGYDLIFFASTNSNTNNYTIARELIKVFNGSVEKDQKVFVLDSYDYIGRKAKSHVLTTLLLERYDRYGYLLPIYAYNKSFDVFNPTGYLQSSDLASVQNATILLNDDTKTLMVKNTHYGYFWSGDPTIFENINLNEHFDSNNQPKTRKAEILCDILEYAIQYAHKNNSSKVGNPYQPNTASGGERIYWNNPNE